MQLQLRIDDDNYVDITFSLSAADAQQPDSSPEVTQAAITNSKLSNLKTSDVFDLTSQILDFFAAETRPANNPPAGDWFTNEWLPNCR